MNARLILLLTLAAFAVGVVVGRMSGPEQILPTAPIREPGPETPHPAAASHGDTTPEHPAGPADPAPPEDEDPVDTLLRHIDRIVPEPPPPSDPIPDLYIGSVIPTPQGDLKILGTGTDYRLARHGRWVTLYPSGKKASEEEYLDGVLQGPAVHWHENGDVKERGRHLDGQRHGLWEQFDPAGNRTMETEYDAGKILSVRSWGPDGGLMTDAARFERATCGGKYRGLLHRFNVPKDLKTYGGFKDYGHYQKTDYEDVKGVPAAYWVYVYPYWYVWEELVE